MEILGLASLAIILGLIGLVWGADNFVAGSVGAAYNFRISPLVIGLTIVSFGTSAPEIIVSIDASLNQAGDIGIGNAIGSNLANIGLVLGVTALICPIPFSKNLLKTEGVALVVAILLGGFFLYDGSLTNTEGLILIFAALPLMTYIFYRKKYKPTQELKNKRKEIVLMSTKKAVIYFFCGLLVLLISADLLVWGAINFAEFFGVSKLIIGLTVVAIGTSLPELAASVSSALKGHHDIAIGTIFGSNLYNLLIVMALPGVIATPKLTEEVFYRDYMSMGSFTLVLLVIILYVSYIARNKGAQATISKKLGLLLLMLYALYYALLMI
jgi:cation:H+ antiporter